MLYTAILNKINNTIEHVLITANTEVNYKELDLNNPKLKTFTKVIQQLDSNK